MATSDSLLLQFRPHPLSFPIALRGACLNAGNDTPPRRKAQDYTALKIWVFYLRSILKGSPTTNMYNAPSLPGVHIRLHLQDVEHKALIFSP